MKVNIYYGGRGLIDDPTIFAINKVQEVLKELRVDVTCYNLYELKNNIWSLPNTLKEADGVVLATTVEWFSIGGYMQQFLDACWLYGDKEKIASLYMFPIVMSKAYGERESKNTLISAWELLGGKPVEGLCAYVDESVDFELNKDYINIIENYAENIYRTISKKVVILPASNTAIKKNVMKDTINLTPQESEQLSKYVSDDTYVQTQKKDIEELSSMFKSMLSESELGGDDYYIKSFKDNYLPSEDFAASYQIIISDKDKYIYMNVDGSNIECSMDKNDDVDVIAKLTFATFDSIVHNRMTFQRAFMSGEMTAKGNFRYLKMLDQIFNF
ncbi:MAG: SCP2 sterol-binding domain-containing protein [Lachnospira sp.]|nr:SCP2 sterol-binding domain-containing protein [Lachnospira sp.]